MTFFLRVRAVQMRRTLRGGPAVVQHPATPPTSRRAAAAAAAKKSPEEDDDAKIHDARRLAVESHLNMTSLQLLVIILGWVVQVLQTFYIWGELTLQISRN